MRKRPLSLLFFAAVLAAPAFAADLPGKTSVALRASTLGMGVELGYTLPVANLSARIGWNGYGYDSSDTIEGIDYDLELDLSSVIAMVDWRPWGQVTHFTAGLVSNGNDFGARNQASAVSIWCRRTSRAPAADSSGPARRPIASSRTSR